MSYLDPPRIHFTGQFWTNPSTINNATENYNLDEQYNNEPPSDTNPNSVWWNPDGQAFFKVTSGQVTAALTPAWQLLTTSAQDPIVGANVVSVITGDPPTPQHGRLVDLDPDQQARSMIVGLKLQLTIASELDVSLAGVIRPMTILDIWGRVIGGSGGGIETAGAMFQSVMDDVEWNGVANSKSAILQKLYQVSPQQLSIKIVVDAYNGDPTSNQFAFGRIVGTIGPYMPGEPIHLLAKRRMFAGGTGVEANSPMNAAPFQVTDNHLTIDLGNSVPTTDVHCGPFKDLGQVVPVIGPGAKNVALPALFSTPQQFAEQYNLTAGIYDLTLDANAQTLLKNTPLGIQISPPAASPVPLRGVPAARLKEGLTQAQTGVQPGTTPATTAIALAERSDGLFVDVDLNALRLQNGAPAWSSAALSGTEITSNAVIDLYATKFGAPVPNLTVNFSLAANQYQFRNDEGEFYNINNDPLSAITINGQAVTATGKYPVTTDANGQATVTFAAGSLSPAQREARRKDLDGQLYLFTHDYTMDVLQPVTLLVFEDSPYVANPTWWTDIYPIFLQYARLYPAMKSLIDLSDYKSVTNAAFGIPDKIKAVLNMPMAHPGFMPVTRDLSLLRRDMINRWFANGMPEGEPPTLS